MIAITNDEGEILQLDPAQKLVTQQAVPWLSDDELPGEFSYPIEAPLNEANKRFVGHGYRPDQAVPVSSIPVNAQMEGVLYRRCTYTFRINQGKLSGFLKIDASEFYDKIRKLTLLEALPDVIYLGDGLSTVLTPTLTRLKQIAMAVPGEWPFTLFPIRNESFLESDFDEAKLPGFTRNLYVNAWERLTDGTLGFPIDLPNLPKLGYLICPQFFLSYVLERIMTLAGYRIESDWLASDEVQRLTIKNMTAMNMRLLNLAEFFTGHTLVAGMFLPDMSVSDFLKAIKGRFGLAFTFNANEKICYITQFTGAVAAGSAIDLTQFQSGPYSTDERDGKGFAVSEYIDEADELFKNKDGASLKPAVQVTGLGQTDVPLKVGTCQLAYESSPLTDNAHWLVPTVRQPGNVLDTAYKLSERYLTKEGKRPNNVGLCLLSYRGMTVDNKGNAYPLATPDIRNGVQQVVGSQALNLGGRKGSWRSYLRPYFYFRDQTQVVTQSFLMPVGILANLKTHRSISLSLEDSIRRSYLVKQLRAEAPGIDGKVWVEAQVLTIPSGIEQPTDQDDPIVYIDLVLGEKRPQPLPAAIAVDGTWPVFLQSVTLRCWADPARTVPSAVTNLPVQLRQRSTLYLSSTPITNLPPSKEYVTTYYANGVSTLVDNDFVQTENTYTSQPVHFDVFERTVQIDPGEGYIIVL